MMSWKRKTGSGGGGAESPTRGAAKEEKVVVPRGHVPMLLAGGDDGGDHGERVLVPVRLLSDPSVVELLDMAAQQYGYGQPGVLRVPCDAGHFRQVLDGAMHRRCGISSSA